MKGFLLIFQFPEISLTISKITCLVIKDRGFQGNSGKLDLRVLKAEGIPIGKGKMKQTLKMLFSILPKYEERTS